MLNENQISIINVVEDIFKGTKNLQDLRAYLNQNDVSFVDNDEQSLLSYIIWNYKPDAVFHSNNNTSPHFLLKIVQEMLNSNKHYLFADKDGMSSLMLAAQEGLDDIVQEILSKNSMLFYNLDIDGDNVFHYSVKWGDFPTMINLLKQHDLNNLKLKLHLKKNIKGEKPKELAKYNKFINSIKHL